MSRLTPMTGMALLAITLAACGGNHEELMQTANLVLLHGRLHTLDPAVPDATALAIVGDRIAKVGSDKEVSALMGQFGAVGRAGLAAKAVSAR